ncbi:translation initiation factor-like protein eif-2b subunit alpha [Biscogniauxia marginata]|nr:translation initiation factor-like protein eif-2b subunit alpha [Biscogniauxia marginata]
MATDDDHVGPGSHELPIRSNPDIESFDIVKTYRRLLADDPDLTMPVAAIEALIEALGASSASTVFETMDLVRAQSERLRRAVRNPVALSHGTDLFQQYLVLSLKQPGPASGGKGPTAAASAGSHENFEVVRQHLMRNGRLFAARAKDARMKIAEVGRGYIRDNYVIMTHGGSRVVETLLSKAAESLPGDPRRRFKVIHVIDEARREPSEKVAAALRAQGIPVATISAGAVAYSMSMVDIVLVGAEAVTANGGVISAMGTYQMAILAAARKKDFFVAAEQHKFGKTFPLTQFKLGFQQDIIQFKGSKALESGEDAANPAAAEDPVDYTPPEYITSFFADHGVLLPSAVAKEVLDFLF